MCVSVEGAGDIDLAEALARSPPSAASTADGNSKGKEITHSLPLSMYSAPGGLRQDPGNAAEWLAEARTYETGSREVRVLSTMGAREDVGPMTGLAL